ncbi:MAG: cytidine deaminase [Planctomycetales bacterium]|nr:cytidine deaminase [Planctomycetales bacterium]
MDNQAKRELIEAALLARSRAYAPYSEFLVGAAVLAEDGTITDGANVENASYGLTLCAERVAVAAAVAAGQRELVALAVAARGGVSPCGACRQFLAEFGPEMLVLMVDADDPQTVSETSLDQLFPEPFRLSGE